MWHIARVMLRITLVVVTAVACVAVIVSVAPPVAHAQSDERLDEEARGIFVAGRAAFDDGRWQEALDYFQRAYELSSRPGLLYNIGQTADRMRQDAVALEAFERYLELMPDAPNRAAVEARLPVLREAVAAAEAETLAAEAEASPPPDVAPIQVEPDTAAPTAPIIVLVTGVATAAAGGVLLLMANGAGNSVTDADEGTAWTDVQSDYDASGTLGVTGGVLLGLGAALAVGGGIWLALWDSGDDHVDVAISPMGAALRGSF